MCRVTLPHLHWLISTSIRDCCSNQEPWWLRLDPHLVGPTWDLEPCSGTENERGVHWRLWNRWAIWSYCLSAPTLCFPKYFKSLLATGLIRLYHRHLSFSSVVIRSGSKHSLHCSLKTKFSSCECLSKHWRQFLSCRSISLHKLIWHWCTIEDIYLDIFPKFIYALMRSELAETDQGPWWMWLNETVISVCSSCEKKVDSILGNIRK